MIIVIIGAAIALFIGRVIFGFSDEQNTLNVILGFMIFLVAREFNRKRKP